MSLAREARNVADHSHDLRCQDRPHTEDLEEYGAGSLHLNSDAFVQFRYPPIKSANVSHHLGGQPPAGSSGSVLWSSATQQLGGGIGRELLLDRIAEEVPQEEEYVEAVEGTGALADQVLASFGEQPQDLGVAFRTILGFD